MNVNGDIVICHYVDIKNNKYQKGKGKCGFVHRLVMNTALRHSGMAYILKGSHSFICTPHFHLLTE